MRRAALLSVVASAVVVASVATASPNRASPTAPPVLVAAPAVGGAPLGTQRPSVAWLARYGSYNVRRGSWSLLPRPTEGC